MQSASFQSDDLMLAFCICLSVVIEEEETIFTPLALSAKSTFRLQSCVEIVRAIYKKT